MRRVQINIDVSLGDREIEVLRSLSPTGRRRTFERPPARQRRSLERKGLIVVYGDNSADLTYLGGFVLYRAGSKSDE